MKLCLYGAAASMLVTTTLSLPGPIPPELIPSLPSSRKNPPLPLPVPVPPVPVSSVHVSQELDSSEPPLSEFTSLEPDPLEQPVETKYFHEPGVGDVLGHYDIRYFRGEPVSYEEKQDTLRHLIRSYLMTFRNHNIETWIAHGTLLGWWWNGKIMPWDWDLDTQVSAATLLWLGENMNMTMHNYTLTTDDGHEEMRDYLLDVNPYIIERVRGDGQNIIDARWIDVRNGLYIDITGLSEVEPEYQPGVWSCKNYHRYRTRELYPLRETVFEDMPALVPFSFDKILTEEYSSRALTKTIHEGHQWKPDQKLWVKLPEKNYKRGDQHTQSINGAKPGLSNLAKVL